MASTTLSYCKLSELEDFRDPGLRALMREMAEVGPDSEFPDGEEHRKAWEIAKTARTLRDFGELRGDAEILGVGAGREPTIFWLTRHVRRVFATDLYLTEDSWSATDSGAQMLIDPRQATPMRDWNPERLVTQHMDGRRLRYEDESFDGIFSSGSIEHFGTLDEIRESVEEMYRVLRPGGVAAIATEYRLDGPPGVPGTVMFDEGELRRVLLDGMPWELASPLDLSVSDETLSRPIDFAAIIRPDTPLPPPPTIRNKVRDVLGILPRPDLEAGEELKEWTPPVEYPHVVLRLEDPKYLRKVAGDREPRSWTSVHVALIKSKN
jgi:SAM-dependent methyltransferase